MRLAMVFEGGCPQSIMLVWHNQNMTPNQPKEVTKQTMLPHDWSNSANDERAALNNNKWKERQKHDDVLRQQV